MAALTRPSTMLKYESLAAVKEDRFFECRSFE